MSRFKDDEWIELEGIVETSTAKALLFNGVNMDEPAWIPKSQCEIASEAARSGELTTLRVKAWIARKNGWE